MSQPGRHERREQPTTIRNTRSGLGRHMATARRLPTFQSGQSHWQRRVGLRAIGAGAGPDHPSLRLQARPLESRRGQLGHAVAGRDGGDACLTRRHRCRGSDSPPLHRYIEINGDMPKLGMLVSQEIQLPGERRDYVYDRLVKPRRDQLVLLLREATGAGVIRQQDPELLFFLPATSISTSVAIRSLIARFTDAAGSMDRFRVPWSKAGWRTCWRFRRHGRHAAQGCARLSRQSRFPPISAGLRRTRTRSP